MLLDLAGVEAVTAALLETPIVVDTLDPASSQAEGTLNWLRRLETVLAANRLSVAATVASQRAVLLAAGRGQVHEGVTNVGRLSGTKLVLATASLVLERVVAEVRDVVGAEEVRFKEAHRLSMQLVAVAYAKGIVTGGDRPLTAEAVSMWLESASADPEMTAGFVNLVALVGRQDSLTLLLRSLELNR